METRPLHERILDAVAAERRCQASRRGLLAGSAKLAGGGALALAFAGASGGLGLSRVLAQQEFEDDVDVLNFALTLEHLEATFYRDGLDALGQDAFGVGPFDEQIGDRLAAIRDHEEAHVETLTQVISDLGGEPVEEAEYDFADAFGSTDAFLATAQVFENLGVSAYDGAGQFLSDPELLTAAGTIVAVEARHAAYLNLLVGVLPFPAATETPLTPAEVLEAAGPFIVSAGATEAEDEGDATDEADEETMDDEEDEGTPES